MRLFLLPLTLVSALGFAQAKPTAEEMNRCVELTRRIIAAARTGGFEAIKPFCALPDGLEKDYLSADQNRVKVLRRFAETVRNFQQRAEKDARLKENERLFDDLAVGRPELSGTAKDPYPEQRISYYDRAVVWTFTFPIRLGTDAWPEQQQGFRRNRWFLFFEPYGNEVRLSGCNGYLGT